MSCCEYCEWVTKTQFLSLEEKIESIKTEILALSIIVAAGHGDEDTSSGDRAVKSSQALTDMEIELAGIEEQLEQSKTPSLGYPNQSYADENASLSDSPDDDCLSSTKI